MIHEKIVEILSYKQTLKPLDKGTYIGNYKCHFNSLSYALSKRGVSCIVGGVQVFYDGTGVAHFIVKLNNGTYIDPTFGNVTSKAYSHFIPLEEYNIKTFKPNRELLNLKFYLYSLLPWYLKLFVSKNDM